MQLHFYRGGNLCCTLLPATIASLKDSSWEEWQGAVRLSSSRNPGFFLNNCHSLGNIFQTCHTWKGSKHYICPHSEFTTDSRTHTQAGLHGSHKSHRLDWDWRAIGSFTQLTQYWHTVVQQQLLHGRQCPFLVPKIHVGMCSKKCLPFV